MLLCHLGSRPPTGTSSALAAQAPTRDDCLSLATCAHAAPIWTYKGEDPPVDPGAFARIVTQVQPHVLHEKCCSVLDRSACGPKPLPASARTCSHMRCCLLNTAGSACLVCLGRAATPRCTHLRVHPAAHQTRHAAVFHCTPPLQDASPEGGSAEACAPNVRQAWRALRELGSTGTLLGCLSSLDRRAGWAWQCAF